MIDFFKIITSGDNYNLHSHTQFCDGKAEMEDFVKEAIKKGFQYYGFSPHSPLLFSSPCNMTFENVEIYLEEVKRLKKKYSSQISLYTSMEIDYIDSEWGPSNSYFQSLPLDYRIGSVHFISSGNKMIDIDGNPNSFKEKMGIYFDNDIKYVINSFYSQTMKMIEDGGFDIIGHFDKIGHNASTFSPGIEEEHWYENLVNSTIQAIEEKKIIMEVNTKAWRLNNRFFPNQRYFNIIKDYMSHIVINSDTHVPELVNSGRKEALTLLMR